MTQNTPGASPEQLGKEQAHDLIRRALSKRAGRGQIPTREGAQIIVEPLLLMAPDLVLSLREALSAISEMGEQISQMQGLFPDEGGAIAGAMQDGTDAMERGHALLKSIPLAITA